MEPERTPEAPSPVRRQPIGYGIDLGTSNSQISGAFADGVEIVDVEVSALPANLPSLLYLHRDGNRSVGNDAVEQYLLTAMDQTACRRCDLVDSFGGEIMTDCRQFRPSGSCADARLLSGIKSDLADKTFTSTHSWAVDFAPPALVAILLRRLKSAADRHFAADVRRVVVGHPVVFAGADGEGASAAQQLAEDRLIEAAHLAGFEDVELYPEPSAALEDDRFDHGRILAADFGGGTFDVAVIDAPRLPGLVAGLAGTPIGGESFDTLLFDAKVAPELGLQSGYVDGGGKAHRFPARYALRLSNLRGLRQLLADPGFEPTLREFQRYAGGQGLGTLEEIIYGGFAYDFYRAIEQAKIDLSVMGDTSIRLERGRTVDVDIPIVRAEFEELIAPYLATVSLTIESALQQAGMTASDVDVVVRTGGSSMIPAFQDLLTEMFGADRVQERGPFTAIAEGLGQRARVLWS